MTGNPKLSATAQDLIFDHANAVLVSAGSMLRSSSPPIPGRKRKRQVAVLERIAAPLDGRQQAFFSRIVDDPAAGQITALRKRLKLSRRKFAERFGLDARAVLDWERGRRVSDRAARVLLTVIDRDPKSVVRALALEESGTGRAHAPAFREARR